MNMKDILKLVEETFIEEISSSCAETVLGLESWIDGKEQFMKKLEEKLSFKRLEVKNKDNITVCIKISGCDDKSFTTICNNKSECCEFKKQIKY